MLAFDKEQPDYRVVHENLDDMSKVTTGQTYQKGAWILHMLRGIVGDDSVPDRHPQLLPCPPRMATRRPPTSAANMERASGCDLREFFDQWLLRGGLVRIDGTWSPRGYRHPDRPADPARCRPHVLDAPAGRRLCGWKCGAGHHDPAPTRSSSASSTEVQIAVTQRPTCVVLDPDYLAPMEATFVEAGTPPIGR